MENRIESYAMKTVGMFIKTDRLHRKAVENLVKEFGLHRSQHRMLMNIARDGGVSQTELAAHLEVSTAAVAVMIKRLEAEGYVEKKTSAGDNRFNEIKITEKGSLLVAESRERFAEVDEAMLNGIDGEMLDNFTRCLEIMQKNLEKLCENEAKEEKSEKMV